jgi:capsid protein
MWPFTRKKDVFDVIFGKEAEKARAELDGPAAAPTMAVSGLSSYRHVIDDGSKFPGGYGATDLLLADYWTLRQRSAELFERNLYARGLIRRLITNEINVGLHLEATPEEAILGFEEDELADWAELVENRFALWAADPRLCDENERMTFGAIQATARMEALVAGDVLVMMRQDQRTRLPRIRLINGASIQTPAERMLQGRSATGNEICHGVERDSTGRHIAYWVRQDDGKSKRLPAMGEKSGRRIAWLLYGTERRLDDVRGKPILSLILQSLKEIDRYRDSTQRKAVINSMLAMFIKKGEDKMGTRPIAGGAIRRGTALAQDTDGGERRFHVAEHIPGLVLDELQTGEEPVSFSGNAAVEGFGVFEEAVLQSIAWANNIPPEILQLSFSSNYSASQAAINEFKLYLNPVRTDFGNNFCRPIYIEWLLAEALAKKIEAPGLLESWRDPALYDQFGGWVSCDWSGNIKPAVKLNDLVSAYKEMCEQGFITRDRASRELTGTKYSKNAQKLKRENELLAEANESIVKPAPGAPPPGQPEQVDPNDEQDDDEEDDDGAAPAATAKPTPLAPAAGAAIRALRA